MKYISIDSVVIAYNGCRGKTQNKFWGLLAIIKAIDQRIEPAVNYSFSTSEVSDFLEELFRLDDRRKTYSTSAKWSVMFSKYWIENIPEQMFDKEPNVYDVATWFFRRTPFDDNCSSDKIAGMFLDSLHITAEEAQSLFSFDKKTISFDNSPYKDSDLLLRLQDEPFVPHTISFEAQKFLKSHPGSLGQAPFVQTLYANQGTQKCLILTQFDFTEYYQLSSQKKHKQNTQQFSLQQIFYGAPGTGKSHKIKNDEKVKEAFDKKLVFRTTFHPDSDYSTFVGAYKPTIKPVADKYKAVAGKDEEITYSFVPQAFLQAYIAAWNNPEDNVFLVIEEINRGNCAQIFGDLFQLLDRDCDGFSEYPIMADNDLKKYLNGTDEEGKDVLTNKDGIKDGKLRLPKNLYIWATMNTSDQSLFPIDSAFKRRWDWVYVPIDTAKEMWYVKVGGIYYSWTTFLDKVNDELLTDETAEDKHLGFYFCKATEKKDGTESDPNVITADTFVGKVLFYLWNDVFKVYGIPSKIGSNKDWPFRRFYQTNGKVDEEKVTELMAKLMIAPEGSNESKEEEAEVQ